MKKKKSYCFNWQNIFYNLVVVFYSTKTKIIHLVKGVVIKKRILRLHNYDLLMLYKSWSRPNCARFRDYATIQYVQLYMCGLINIFLDYSIHVYESTIDFMPFLLDLKLLNELQMQYCLLRLFVALSNIQLIKRRGPFHSAKFSILRSSYNPIIRTFVLKSQLASSFVLSL